MIAGQIAAQRPSPRRRPSRPLEIEVVDADETLDARPAVTLYVDMCIAEIGLTVLGIPHRAA